MRPLGLVQVQTPAAVMLTDQPCACLVRWWWRHRHCRLWAVVGPAGHVVTWCEVAPLAVVVQPAMHIPGFDEVS